MLVLEWSLIALGAMPFILMALVFATSSRFPETRIIRWGWAGGGVVVAAILLLFVLDVTNVGMDVFGQPAVLVLGASIFLAALFLVGPAAFLYVRRTREARRRAESTGGVS